MNKKMIAGGVALMLLSIAIPASAYHITGQTATVPIGGATTSHDWFMAFPAANACESDGPDDPVNDLPAANEGHNGLCYMSVGHFPAGNANGHYHHADPKSAVGRSNGICPDGTFASPYAGTPSAWPCANEGHQTARERQR